MSDYSLLRSRHGPRIGFRSVIGALARARALHRQRRALAELETRLLDDVGLTRVQAHREAARPFWDAPGHWKS